MWALFVIGDIIHYIRTPITFILIGIMIDELTLITPQDGIPSDVVWIIIWLFILQTFAQSMHVIMGYRILKWRADTYPKIRIDLLDYLQNHSYQFFQNHFAGALARKILEAVENINRFLETIRIDIFASIVTMTFTTISAFFIHAYFGLFFVLFAISVSLPTLMALRKIKSRSLEYSHARANVTGHTVDCLSNNQAVRSFATEDNEIEKHIEVTQDEIRTAIKLQLTMHQISNFRRISLIILSAFMPFLCVYAWSIELITIGEATTLIGMAFSLGGFVWNLGNGMTNVADQLGYISDALTLIAKPHEVIDKDSAKDLEIKRSNIVINDVIFKYSDQNLFENLNLTIPQGQKLGLVGQSGAGKSSLVSLLLRLYDIQLGSIEIDGQNIAEVTQESLRKNIAVIPQDTSLFHRTLMDNIRYGRLDATDKEVIAAAKKAHAHDFISELPDGYETLVGERGVKLSGGQRQRVTIARAILKDAPILILDEATSALDSESEKLIQNSLKTLMKGKTVIAIAHRLSTIAHLDRIIVMDKGQIVEDGTHEELLKDEKHYAKLWSMQSGGFLGE